MDSAISTTMKKRKIKDCIANGVTGVSSFFSIFILLSIIIFVFIKGIPNFDLRMIASNYYETPYFARVDYEPGYACDDEVKEGVYLSERYGVGLENSKDINGDPCIHISYIAEDSPFVRAKDNSTGELIEVSEGQILKRVQLTLITGNVILTPKVGAMEIVHKMDESTMISELYYASMGGGIRGSLLTTLLLIVTTLIIAVPIGVVAAIYLSIYAKKNKLTTILRSLIDMIAGVPSIIFGFIGIIVFIPFISTITPASGGSIISGALTMTIILLPTIIKTTEESINEIPKGYQLSSLALGASETQTTFKVILPNALGGILTAVILSVGRIIGESAALIFAIGTSIQDQVSLFDGSTTLAVHIWTIMSGQNPNYTTACAISMIILIFVLLLNLLLKVVVKKLNRFEVK